MKRLDVIQTGGKLSLSYKLASGEKPDQREIDAILRKNMGNIKVPVFSSGLFSSSFKIDIHNADTLKKVLRNGVSMDRFLEIFADITKCLEDVERLQLRVSGLITDPEGIFVLKSTGTIEMVYIPCIVNEPKMNIFAFPIGLIDFATIIGGGESQLKKLRESIAAQSEISFEKVLDTVNTMRGLKEPQKQESQQTSDFGSYLSQETGFEKRTPQPDKYNQYDSAKDDRTAILNNDYKDDKTGGGDDTLLLYGNTTSKHIVTGYFESKIPQRSFTVREDSVIVGRSAKAGQSMAYNDAISSMHAEIIREDQRFYIVDNYSSNGTKINGFEIDPGARTELSDGDIVVFADEEFRFHIQ